MSDSFIIEFQDFNGMHLQVGIVNLNDFIHASDDTTYLAQWNDENGNEHFGWMRKGDMIFYSDRLNH